MHYCSTCTCHLYSRYDNNFVLHCHLWKCFAGNLVKRTFRWVAKCSASYYLRKSDSSTFPVNNNKAVQGDFIFVWRIFHCRGQVPITRPRLYESNDSTLSSSRQVRTNQLFRAGQWPVPSDKEAHRDSNLCGRKLPLSWRSGDTQCLGTISAMCFTIIRFQHCLPVTGTVGFTLVAYWFLMFQVCVSLLTVTLQSQSGAFHLHLHVDNGSDVFCFLSSCHMLEPRQPSHGHPNQFRIGFLQYIFISAMFQ